MAERRLTVTAPAVLSAFERAFDELFEELLIAPWQAGERPRRASVGKALVLDLGNRYEVRIPATRAQAEHCEVEVSEHRLRVRMADLSGGTSENVFDFPFAIETENVRAVLAEGALQIILPRKRGRRIDVE